MRGSPGTIALVVVLSLVGIWFVCAGFTGYAVRVMTTPMRVAFVVVGVLLLLPFQASVVNAWLNAAGALAGAMLFAYEWRASRSSLRTA